MNKNIFLVSIVTCLTACGGGGGGGSNIRADNNTGTTLVRYSQVGTAERIQIRNAQTQEATWTQDPATTVVESISAPSTVGFTGSLDETYYSQELGAASYTTSEGTLISFGTGDVYGYWTQNPNIGITSTQDGTDYILYSNPYLSGFEYQNYGVWVKGGGTAFGSVGTISVGLVADSSVVPPTGSAVYTGSSVGFYAGDVSAVGDAPHTSYFVDADVSLTADFAAGSITFATSNSILTSDFEQAYSDTTNLLDLTGTLTISGTGFTGDVSNGDLLSGNATGRFYGNATEVGGTFLVQESGAGSNKDSYMGAFGASSL